jgi:hypothetical protein
VGVDSSTDGRAITTSGPCWAGGLSLVDLHAVATIHGRNEIIGVEIAEFEGTWPDSDEFVRPTALLDALTPLWS